MTREELQEHLAAMTNMATDDDTVSRVDAIMAAFDGMTDTGDYSAVVAERDQLRQELADERERFKNRFWGRDEPGAPSPAPLVNIEPRGGATIFAAPEELADIWK